MTATLDDLLSDAHHAEFTATARLISDWERKGLLDYRYSPGLGRGKGRAKGTWSDHQRRLFQELVRLRPTVKRFATLTNLPVWLWLVGDNGEVPLSQARRAFKTWLKDASKRGWKHSQKSARETVRLLVDKLPERHKRQDLIEQLATAIHNQEPPNTETSKLLRWAFDPYLSGRMLGAPDAPLNPDVWLKWVDGRMAVLESLRDLPDEAFEQARVLYRTSWLHYLRERPQLQKESTPETQRLFAPPTLSDLVERACSDLLTNLSLVRLSEEHM